MGKIIAITGGTGSIGREAVKALMLLPEEFSLRILVSSNKKAVKYYNKSYGERVQCFFGDVRNYSDCEKLVDGASYIFHMAAVIPPKADHNAKVTMSVNYDGTATLVRAIKAYSEKSGTNPFFVFMSTVAIYGARSFRQRWGRVGDPLVTSAFDVYGSSKILAERCILDAELENFMILRQTAVLYDNLLTNNIKDGLVFHTDWNCAIEWVTAYDTGILLRKIVERHENGTSGEFNRKVFNIGGGVSSRQTGYETFNDGFSIIGGSAKTFFKPNWNPTRNFHCFWFSDSDDLENIFHFRTQSNADFWKWYKRKHRVYGLGRLIPPFVIKNAVLKPLLKNSNAPLFWVNNGDEGRVQAFFGGRKKYNEIPSEWKDFTLECERAGYEELKPTEKATFLDHGYDESKPDSELGIEDMRAAAKFRGGECLSTDMVKGDLYSKLKWKCHDGHVFYASPYTVLKAGHWCNECCYPYFKWNFDELSDKIPFFAQVWRDTHSESERYVYGIKDGKSYMEIIEDVKN